MPEGGSREEYHVRVTGMIAALRRGEARKAVLSRRLVVETEAFRRRPVWFDALVGRYPEEFVFFVSVPGCMTWMGATPETFLEGSEAGVRTMSLAGTRPAGTPGVWGGKELEEQAIVTEFIEAQLKRAGSWKTEGPFVKRAGGVEHLCTVFRSEGRLEGEKVDALRGMLHPTPAVGGFPKREACDLIRRIEGGDRRYYAGYVESLHADGTFPLVCQSA